MKPKSWKHLTGRRSLMAALAITALAATGTPVTAAANTTANTTVLNIVTVSYKDATGNNPLSANASASVTVNLVKSALNLSAAPSSTTGIPAALTCLTPFESPSGSTIKALYALTATANGSDTYNLSMATGTQTNVSNVSVNYTILNSAGAPDVALPANPNPATRVMGAAIPLSSTGTNQLNFPGGALAGFANGDIVIVPTLIGNQAFLVTGVHVGTAPVFSHVGNTAYTDATGALTTLEDPGTLTLGPWTNVTLSLNGPSDTVFGGGGISPTFNGTGAPTIGQPVGKMILVEVDVFARTNATTDGTVAYTLTTTPNLSPLLKGEFGCTAGNFQAPSLSIKKEVRNTTSGGFGATATGNPGDILEYRITVANSNGQGAQVAVSDLVPVYTSLVTFSGSYGATAPAGNLTDIFARVSETAVPANFVDLTRDPGDSETQSALQTAAIAYGNSTATLVNPVPAGTALSFFLGDTANKTTGGLVPACSITSNNTTSACTTAAGTWVTSYTILFQVKVN